jgi:hypothetical protein
MQQLWAKRMNFKFGWSIEVRQMMTKMTTEKGQSNRQWDNNSTTFNEESAKYSVPLSSSPEKISVIFILGWNNRIIGNILKSF